jgi:hypothetical protein
LISFSSNHETVIPKISQQLISQGMVVIQSFDLQVAKSIHTGCTCPHHGTKLCDCQIVVLLVYDENEGPVSLIVHSQDGRTYLSMMEIPDTEKDGTLEDKVFKAFGNLNTHNTPIV